MNSIGKFVSSITQAFDVNQSNLSGSIDVIAIRQPDGSLKCTPFHARFGKFKLLKSKDKVVRLQVNGADVPLRMKLGEAGEAFFEEELTPEIEYTVQEKILLGHNERVPQEQDNSVTDLVMKQRNGACDGAMEIEGFSPLMNAKEALTMKRNVKSSPGSGEKRKVIKVKTLRPTNEQLQSLNLKMGRNTVTYIVESNLQGTQTLTSDIYLWSHDINLIISDIDGTITKTDVMGHMLSMVGKDWSQPGIAPLFQNIRRNGYHILYLTARPIGQAAHTREFLQSIYQDGTMLPHGPMITSPDGFLSSFKREIVFKRPDVFKMAVLKDIKSLFPGERNPFHAGFGNRDTDAVAYRSVGMSLDKVFIVNPKGHIHHHCHRDNETKSYALLNAALKEIFPGIVKDVPVPEANILCIDDKSELFSNVQKVVS